MPSDGERVRSAFLAAGRTTARLLRDRQVHENWGRASVLAHWSVGGLAGHLARAVLTFPRYLDGAPPTDASQSVDAAGYLLLALSTEDLAVDSRLATAIRARGDEEASRGPVALADDVEHALGTLVPLLGRQRTRVSGRRVLGVLEGITVPLDEYLRTRVLELVVHLDDVAASLDRDVAAPPHAVSVATELLVEVARRRHGDLALIHALARRERALDLPLAL